MGACGSGCFAPIVSKEQSHLEVQGWCRWLNVSGLELVCNFRDCAGTHPHVRVKVEGGVLRKGLLFRSGAWTAATAADVARLRDHFQIKTYLDLRCGEWVFYEGAHGLAFETYPPSPSSYHATSEPRGPGELRRVALPSDPRLARRGPTGPGPDQRSAAERLEGHMAALMKSPELQENVRKTLECLADARNYPVAFGCTAGKDRTGLIAMLVQKALGAADWQVIEEYMISCLCNGHIEECFRAGIQVLLADLATRDPAKREELLQQPLYSGCAAPKSRLDIAREKRYWDTQETMVWESVARVMLGTLRQAGGVEAYLTQIGFGPEQVAKLREILVEPERVPKALAWTR